MPPHLSVKDSFALSDGILFVHGVPILTYVPDNVFLTGFSSICHSDTTSFPSVASNAHKGSFLGLNGDRPSSRVLNSLGKLRGINFMSIFRFKIWWSTMLVGSNGRDLQMETQLLLLDVQDIKSYVLILPIIEGKFRAALHPGEDDGIDVCVESGSSSVESSVFNSCVYVHSSDNPYDLMTEAYTAMRVHLGSFRLREEKGLPNIIDKFGWCTWDAFYLTVNPVGVWDGVKELVEGGCPPRFVIIDDGWQSINLDGQNPFEDVKDDLVLGGPQMTARMYRYQECDKFKKYRAGTMRGPNAPKFDQEKHKQLIEQAIMAERLEKEKLAKMAAKNSLPPQAESTNNSNSEVLCMEEDKQGCGSVCDGCFPRASNDTEMGLKTFLNELREEFPGVDDVYVWHALCGAWGGVRPGTIQHPVKIIPTNLSSGLSGMMQDLAVDKVVEGGIGLVHPTHAAHFYNTWHSYLAGVGVTGVKVDVFHTLELVAEEYGGRVELAKIYYEGLSQSLKNNFGGSGLIASMEQCNDFFFLGTKEISVGRVGDDFWFQDPNGDPMGAYWLQGVHMIHCGYNSLWMGNFIQPDWDMFQSDHVCAEFHAASRAICGGAVYVSDSIGGHDFDLLKKLLLPDGTILRCSHYALPTRDCIFKDPLRDGHTMFKLWNLNKFGGVIGAFNCQGAGWCPEERKLKAYPQFYVPITGSLSPNDVEWTQKEEAAAMARSHLYAVYMNKSNNLLLMKSEESFEFTLQPSSFEIFTIVPVQSMSPTLKFAGIGLVNMFNCGGAIQGFRYGEDWVEVDVKGTGKFLAYATKEPKTCKVNEEVDVPFEWRVEESSLLIQVPWKEDGSLSLVHLLF